MSGRPLAAQCKRRVLPPVASDASVVWLQLVAVIAMVLDHFNWFLYAHGGDPRSTSAAWMNSVGRIAFPLFAFTFGVNLARVLNGPHSSARIQRMFRRLAVAAAAAQLAYWPLRGYFNPLNVMATFLLTAWVLVYWSRSTWASNALGRCVALAIAVVLGAFVEYWWFGIALIAAAYRMAASGSWSSCAAFLMATATLCLLNQNGWALAAIPVIALLMGVRWAPARPRGWLYRFYPLHLFAILAIVEIT